MARPANRRRLHAELRLRWLQNLVRCMAIRADRRLHVSGGYCLAVRPAHVVVVDLGVTTSARLGDVGLVRWTRRIFATQDVVRTVAALAVRRHKQAFLA